MLRIRSLVLALALGTVAAAVVTPSVAEARAGRSRSVGRRQAPPQAPAQSQPNYNNQAQTPINSSPSAMPPQRPGGGFLRGMAGGIAGGFLGSMLFSSLGHATGIGGGAGGGIGFLEILLFAGLAYFAVRWWRGRQQQQPATISSRANWMRQGVESGPYAANSAPSFRALQPEALSADEAGDLFFKVQGGWTRRDLQPIRHLLTSEMETTLGIDLAELRSRGHMNRLENISVRQVEIGRTWSEDGVDHCVAKITASLLDYTVDERTQNVVEGSDHDPVKFEEDWIFAKISNAWRLAGIEQR